MHYVCEFRGSHSQNVCYTNWADPSENNIYRFRTEPELHYSHTQYMSHDMTKPTKWVCAQRRVRSTWTSAQSKILRADSEDSDQTVRMPRLIWVFTGRTLTLLILSCPGSYGTTESFSKWPEIWTYWVAVQVQEPLYTRRYNLFSWVGSIIALKSGFLSI